MDAFDVHIEDGPNFNQSKMSEASRAGAVKSHDCGEINAPVAPAMPDNTNMSAPDLGQLIPVQD